MRRRWFLPFRQRLHRENWLALGLLLATFVIMVMGVARAVSGLEISLLWFPVFLGVALGWGLAASPASGRLAAFITVLIGLTVIIIQISNLITLMADLASSLIHFIRAVLFLGTTTTIAPLNNDWDELSSAAGTLVARLYDWLLAFRRGEPVFDPVALAFLWLAVLWGAAVWAG